MTCANGKCEYTGTATRCQPIQTPTEEEIRYCKLWAEIEPPKLLKEVKTHE